MAYPESGHRLQIEAGPDGLTEHAVEQQRPPIDGDLIPSTVSSLAAGNGCWMRVHMRT